MKNSDKTVGLPLIVFLLTTLLPSFSWTQYAPAFKKAQLPRIMFGGDVALFRISLDEFDSIYKNRWGTSYAGYAGVRIYSTYYATFKYGSFQKDGKTGVHKESGHPLQNAHWDERWYKIGARVHPMPERQWNSYYGFGFAFYDVDENQPVAVFEKSETKELGTGFYMDLGLEYYVREWAALYFELGISSGGMQERIGFEAMSIGGYRFALGLTVLPF